MSTSLGATGPLREGLAGNTRNPSKVGMMGACFFASRSDLLQWVNDTLGTSLSKVEQCSSGAVYCQIVDAANGGNTVRMNKVNWNASAEPEAIANYKLLQSAFSKLNVSRNVDVDKLVRGKYQDNLEFLQWMKHYYDSSYSGTPYDPYIRRENKQLPAWAIPSVSGPNGGNDSQSLQKQSSQNGGPRRGSRRENSLTRNSTSNTSKSNTNSLNQNNSNLNPNEQTQELNNTVNSTRSYSTRPGAGPGPGGNGNNGPGNQSQGGPNNENPMMSSQKQQQEIRKLNAELKDMKSTVDNLETERDFYFGKLREVEILCQNLDPSESDGDRTALERYTAEEMIREIQKILYKE